jgi:amino-acid N-acetyltransferase
MSQWRLTEPAADDLPELLALLRDCGLPHRDVTTNKLSEFMVCRAEGRLIATAGLEVCGDAVLLRSLAVLPGYRQRGLASQLLEALQQRLRARRHRRIFLLTTTAPEFFAARGFDRCARQLVPPGIAETSEFRKLCPASATCMHKQLDDQALP